MSLRRPSLTFVTQGHSKCMVPQAISPRCLSDAAQDPRLTVPVFKSGCGTPYSPWASSTQTSQIRRI